MTPELAFAGVRSVLLDTGPAIYALEKNADRGSRTKTSVEHLFDAGIEVVATPITLAECIAGASLRDTRAYVEFLTRSQEIAFVPLDAAASLLA